MRLGVLADSSLFCSTVECQTLGFSGLRPSSVPRLAPAALRRDRLGPAATSELVRRVSLVDLVSTGSESSAADWRRPTSAATAAAAIAGPPQTVLLSGSEGDSQPTSIGE